MRPPSARISASAAKPSACASSASSKWMPSPASPEQHAHQQVDQQARQPGAGRRPARRGSRARVTAEPTSRNAVELVDVEGHGHLGGRRGAGPQSIGARAYRSPGLARNWNVFYFGRMSRACWTADPRRPARRRRCPPTPRRRRRRGRLRHRRRLRRARGGPGRRAGAAARAGRGPRRHRRACPAATSTSAAARRCSRPPATRTRADEMYELPAGRHATTPSRRRSAPTATASVEHFDWLEALGFEFERSLLPREGGDPARHRGPDVHRQREGLAVPRAGRAGPARPQGAGAR